MNLDAIASRFANYGPAGHPVSRARQKGDAFSRDIAEGTPPAEALAAAGASPAVIAWAREAKPDDLPAVLGRLAAAIGRGAARDRALRGVALYPAMLSVAVVFLAVVVTGFARARLQGVVDATHGSAAAPSVPLVPVLLSILVAAATLAWLAEALRSRAPRAPFAAVHRRHQRAIVLAAASAAADSGVDLSRALRASAALAAPGDVSTAARAIADALERGDAGRVPAADVLFGGVGGAVFLSSAREGAGTPVLSALATLAESEAATSLPFEIVRAEMLSLGVGAAGVAVAAAAFIHLYSEAIRIS